MPNLTEEDLIGSVEEAAELQNVLGVDLMRDQVTTPPPQPSIAFGIKDDSSTQTSEGITITREIPTTPTDSNTDQTLEQPGNTHATTSPDSSATTSQEQNPSIKSSSDPSLTTSTLSTPKKTITTNRKSTPTTSSPRPRSAAKRKSRTLEDSDSEYRAPSTPRSKARRSRVTAKPDDDNEYGPLRFASRTMTRPVRRGPRYGANEDAEAQGEADRQPLCIASCDRAEDGEMMGCAGGCEHKFHAPCVGFRAKLPDGRRWLCFECRKVRGLGMRRNGVVAEGEDGELCEVGEGGRMEEEWRRDGWMV